MSHFPFGKSLFHRFKRDTPSLVVFLKQLRCTRYIHLEREWVGLRINAAEVGRLAGDLQKQ